MLFEIPRCYDSHVHFQATGWLSSALTLFHLKSVEDLPLLQVKPHHFRGEWLVGFGWDENKWQADQKPLATYLDRVFPNFPVAFTRADGHAVWLNSRALQKIDYYQKTSLEKPDIKGGMIHRDSQGFPTGLFVDLAKIYVDSFIPAYSSLQEKMFLDQACSVFNKAGFTHVRDMSGSLGQWHQLQELERQKKLSVYLEENFSCENLQDFDRALRESLQAREESSEHLRVAGIKLYLDGSLGSETAMLSEKYGGRRGQGLLLWPREHIEEILIRSWEKEMPVSVHVIGDATSEMVVDVAFQLSQQGKRGPLSLEHCQVLKPQTLAKMKFLNLRCHMQPCHYLSDRRWLQEKLAGLYPYVFPWAAIEKENISLSWGSDSPIEEPSVFNTLKALRLSPNDQIPALSSDPLKYYSHPDPEWGRDCKTLFTEDHIKEIIFDGRALSPGH